MTLLGTFLKPMHREGVPFIAAFGAISFALSFLWYPLGWVGIILTVWCYYFFRDPSRVTPTRPGLIISPADGVVSLITMATPPPELGLSTQPLLRVSIFMNVFNCHVNRAPAAGRIKALAYHPGKFLSASLDKASDENERCGLILEMADGQCLGVVQIAGLVARRIVSFVKPGEMLETGERFGLIRFGSRVDVYLPKGAEPLVVEGQAAVAGETVLADLHASEGARQGREA